ncbi:sporulation protein [Aneurinibacillus thermoaerophilus]|nr:MULTISPECIES: sporulation protein [Aneurinibacillus]MED0680489.1 sporulation protein [Aneurinibacillus thermoaerophilus]
MMAKLGFGSARVDLVLRNSEFILGDTVEGELVIQGGAVEQYIKKIDVQFMMAIRTKQNEYRQAIATIPFACNFNIGAEERKVFPFRYELPKDLLISSHTVAYYFVTNLDIAAGVDNQDRDYIRVNPPQRFQNIIAAFEQLGFREKHDSRKFNGYAQEFEFFPTTFLRDRVKEVEFIAAIEEEQIRLLLELDLPSFGHEVEIKHEVALSNELLADPASVADYLRGVMEEMVDNPHAYLHQRSMMEHDHHHHRHGGFAGAMGGFAAGLLGGMILSEIMDEVMDGVGGGDAIESAFDGGDDGGGFGDFFGDMFDGGDE